MTKTFTILLSISLFLFSSCSLNNSAEPIESQRGNIDINIRLGKIGVLSKMSTTEKIALKMLHIRLSNGGNSEIIDSVQLSGNDEIEAIKSYSSLQAGSDWELSAWSYDESGEIIHSGAKHFIVEPGKTSKLLIDLPSRYSILIANFNSIPDSINKCELLVDGNVKSFQEFPQDSKKGDTIGLFFNYVPAIPAGQPHKVTLNAYGTYLGQNRLLYTGEFSYNAISRQDSSSKVVLRWVGPSIPPQGFAEIVTNIGNTGMVILNGEFEQNEIEAISPFAVDANVIALFDFNGNGNDFIGPRQGMLTDADFVPSPFGRAIQFLKSTSSSKPICRVPHDQKLAVTVTSLEALVYADSLSSGYSHIIDKSWSYGITLYGNLICAYFADQNNRWISKITCPLKEWVYICATFDGSKAVLFLNGIAADSSNYSYSASDGASYDLGIGNASVNTHNVPFMGKIDALRISSIARNREEISQVWNLISEQISFR